MNSATVGERGQVTIAKALREAYGLTKGVKVDFIPQGTGILVQKQPVEDRLRKCVGIIKHIKSTDEYMEEIRGR
jgi:bifunctional DNA-binding transcriptional regulator/antitoxin component of YhaV-PrlF toxin-antitoxin module